MSPLHLRSAIHITECVDVLFALLLSTTYCTVCDSFVVDWLAVSKFWLIRNFFVHFYTTRLRILDSLYSPIEGGLSHLTTLVLANEQYKLSFRSKLAVKGCGTPSLASNCFACGALPLLDPPTQQCCYMINNKRTRCTFWCRFVRHGVGVVTNTTLSWF